jgi:uncharacterized protein YaiI (UPF0178 family)
VKLYIDADACPQVIKTIVYRAAARTKRELILVANSPFNFPKAPNIKFVLVGKGFDVADNYIVQQVEAGDLVITADIPLAAGVIEKGGYALNPRGEFYDPENIKHKLAVRNLMTDLRSIGEISGGPRPFGQREQQDFANALDRFLAKKSP